MNARSFHRLCSLVLVALLSLAPARATDKCGAVCDETWDLAGSPYIVTCDVTLAAGCSLDIDAGVSVRFKFETGLVVDGDLTAAGSHSDTILFTADTGTQQAGDWRGLEFRTGSIGSIAHSAFTLAGIALQSTSAFMSISDSTFQDLLQTGVEASGGTLNLSDSELSFVPVGIDLTGGVSFTLDNVAAHGSEIGIYAREAATGTVTDSDVTFNTYGLYVNGSMAGPTTVDVTDSLFTSNILGIFVDSNRDPGFVNPAFSITASSIFDNSDLDLAVLDYHDRASTIVRAGGNWWGTTDAAAIAAKITDYKDLPTRSPKVDWCAYLDGPPPAGVPAHDSYCPALYVCDEAVAWSATDQPYLLTSAVTVCPTGILDIGPGVSVRAVASTFVEVEGELNVIGTEPAPALLTSNSATPATHDWMGLQMLPGSSASVEWAEIAYATSGIEGSSAGVSMANATVRDCGFGVDASGGSLSATHSVFGDNFRGLFLRDSTAFTVDGTEVFGSAVGMWIDDGASGTLTDLNVHANQTGLLVGASTTDPTTVDVTGSTFTANASGIFVRGSDMDPTSINPAFTVSASSIFDNTDSNVYAAGFLEPETAVIQAGGNWWGTTDSTAIGAKIVDFFSSSPTVDWCQYLNGPPPGAGLAHRAYCPDLQICDQSVAWNATDQRYLITSTVKICPTGTLNVGPGVSLNVVPGFSSFRVDGTLNVNGTEATPVQIFSNSASAAPGDWTGLVFRDGSTGSISAANISHAFRAVRASLATVSIAGSTIDRTASVGVEADGGWLSIVDTKVTDVDDLGIFIDAGASFMLRNVETSGAQVGISVRGPSTGTITDAHSHSNTYGLSVLPSVDGPTIVDVHASRFVGNNDGVSVSGGGNGFIDPEVVVSSSSLHDNTSFNFIAGGGWEAPGSTTVWAPDNWWGTTNPDEIAEGIYDRNDSQFAPRVVTRPFGSSCEAALGRNEDFDSRGDFEDNCPAVPNTLQSDADDDGMGDACDPQPAAAPTGPCDGVTDVADGYADADGDGWGNPCDFHPLRADSYPGAPEICDGRDNDGDLVFADGELVDLDEDGAVACVDLTGDCDDTAPAVFPCACESCGNSIDDDCDGSTDVSDATCLATPFCVSVVPGSRPLELGVDKGDCGGPVAAGPFDVIRGEIANLGFSGTSVDLGDVTCSSANLAFDRVTDLTEAGSPGCDDSSLFWLAAPTGAPGYGSASGGQPREITNPDPVCP